MDYAKIERAVEKAVKAAGNKIAALKEFKIENKGDAANIVTSSDLAVQHELMKALKKLIPSSGFFCEEEDCRDNDAEYLWIIDPIDGTTNYSRGIGECAVSVALLCNRIPKIGVVYNPFQKLLYTAIAGQGARLNGKPIHVSQKPFPESLFCTAMSLYKKSLAPVCFDIISDVYGKSNDIRRLGSCATELCYLAAGRCELYFEIRVFPWDYAGSLLVLKEAGGIIKGWNGEELSFDKPSVVIAANTQENFETLNEIVNKYIKEVPYEETL